MSKPSFLKNIKKKICLICEGFEEFDYISKLLELKVWSDEYYFIPINAEGSGNITPIYQNAYANDEYDIILAICDTDKYPYKEFQKIRTKINNNIFGNSVAADKVLIFTNPCTMQVILSHFGNVKLKTQSKSVNDSIIKNLTGLSGTKKYDGCKEHRDYIFSQITKSNYQSMKSKVASLPYDYTETPSSNFILFFNYFEDNNIQWIDNINNIID